MEKIKESMSTSLLVYYLRNHLPNNVEIWFNSNEKDGDSWIIYPVIEGKTSYHYYIPLSKQIKGYDYILVSNRAAEYLKLYPERINRMRIRFYPWPEIVLPYRDNFELYAELDSLVLTMLQYGFGDGYIYEKSTPLYTRLIFNGFKRNSDFKKRNGLVKEGYFYDPDNQYLITL